MDTTDYTKKLNDERKNYYDRIQDNNKSHKEHIKSLKSAHAKTKENQQTAYLKDRIATEKSYQDRYKSMSDSQRSKLNEKSERYKEALKSNQEEFNDIRKRTLEEYKNKISDVKDAYSKSKEIQQQSHKDIQDSLKENYESRVENIRSKGDSAVKEYSENADLQLKKVNESHKEEQRNLVKKTQGEINSNQRLEARSRAQLKDKVSKQLENIRSQVKSDKETAQRVAGEKFAKLVEDSDSKIKKLQDQSQAEIVRLNQGQKDEIQKLRVDEQKSLAKQKRGYEELLRKEELKTRLNGVGSKSEQLKEQTAELKDIQQEAQIKTLFKERSQLEEKYTNQIENMSDEFDKNYREKTLDKAIAVAELEADSSKKLALQRVKYEKELELQNNQSEDSVQQLKHENEIVRSRDTLKSKTYLKRLKENFSRDIEGATKKSQSDFEVARQDMNEEKAYIQKTLRESNNKLLLNTKKDSEVKIAKIRQAYEQKIGSLENQNKALANKVEEVSSLQRNILTDKFERREEIIKKEAESKVKSKLSTFEIKEKSWQRKLSDVQRNYDKKMNELISQKDSEIKRKDFEAKKELQDLKDRLTRKIDQNQLNFDREVARISAASEAEKGNLITQYEERINKLEEINKKKLEEVEQFKRLS